MVRGFATESVFHHALAIPEKLLGSERLEVPSVFSNPAMVEYLRHSYSDAEFLDKRALNMWNKVSELRSRDFAQTLQNVSVLFLTSVSMTRPERFSNERSQNMGQGHADVARGLRKVAALTWLAVTMPRSNRRVDEH